MIDGVESNDSNRGGLSGYLGKIAPGLPKLLHYKKSDLPHDILAGLSVAAVA